RQRLVSFSVSLSLLYRLRWSRTCSHTSSRRLSRGAVQGEFGPHVRGGGLPPCSKHRQSTSVLTGQDTVCLSHPHGRGPPTVVRLQRTRKRELVPTGRPVWRGVFFVFLVSPSPPCYAMMG